LDYPYGDMIGFDFPVLIDALAFYSFSGKWQPGCILAKS
jgi:hypothetical protein